MIVAPISFTNLSPFYRPAFISSPLFLLLSSLGDGFPCDEGNFILPYKVKEGIVDIPCLVMTGLT